MQNNTLMTNKEEIQTKWVIAPNQTQQFTHYSNAKVLQNEKEKKKKKSSNNLKRTNV